MIFLYFIKKTNLLDKKFKKLLHVAPEWCLKNLFFGKVVNLNYITADLNDPRTMVKMDIMDIKYAENSFDAIYCSHVLEHVTDDKKALSEFYRILKPGGWVIILVPIIAKEAFEDPTITSSEQREAIYGQFDHVRKYGIDFAERVKQSGFILDFVKASEFLSERDIKKMGIKDDYIFHCKK